MRLQASFSRLGAMLGAGLALGGCDSCGSDAPYTPYVVDSNAPASASPSASGAPSSETPAPSATSAPAPGFQPRAALKAPASAGSSWNLEGIKLTAPSDHRFVYGVSADFDGDQKPDAVSWTRAVRNGLEGGALWMHAGAGGEPKKLADFPGFIPTGPECKHTVALTQTGTTSVTVDISARCETRLLARAPVRSLMVVAPGKATPELASLRVAKPAPGESLQLTVDSSDRDGDGSDDVDIRVSLRRPDERRDAAHASLRWYSRAAGSARQESVTQSDFNSASARASGLARTAKTADQALASVDRWRRMFGSLCSESGTPRIFDGQGNAFECGVGKALSRLQQVELDAYVAKKDALGGLAALQRSDWFGGAAPSGYAKKLQRLTQQHSVKRFDKLTPKPLSAGPEPRFSPLAFEESGDLLIQTVDQIKRISADGTEAEVSDEVDRWPLAVTGPDGQRWSALVLSCDRSEVSLVFSGAKSTTLTTSVLAPRPGPCTGSQGPAHPSAQPLSWTGKGLEAVIAGSWVGPRMTPAEAAMRTGVRGAARAPDGKGVVIATPLGLLVVAGEKLQLWHGGKLTDGAALRDCVLAPDLKAAACIRDGAAYWIEPA